MKDTLHLFNPGNTTSIGKYAVILFFTLFPCTIPTLYADDQSPTPDLFIESKTDYNSANCVIQGTDPEQDKERTEIGVGETVNLELKGKRLGEVTRVTWKIVPDGNGASVKAIKDNVKKAVLTANQNSTEDSNATVEVTTNIDSSLNPSGPRQKTFQIRVPSNIKGKHSGMRVAGYPQDETRIYPEHQLNLS